MKVKSIEALTLAHGQKKKRKKKKKEIVVIYCSFCKHWVHKRCSGLKGRLTIAPSFKCHSCLHLPKNGNEVHKIKLDNVEYERVNRFCYLGDMFSPSSAAEASSIT